MRAYDRIGRSAWSAFLARFEVPHLRHPVDLRFDEGIRATRTQNFPATAATAGEPA